MLRSPPSRRRGLKLKLVKILGLLYLSPPSRRRGLKYYQGHLQPLKDVASFAEAWIEIVVTSPELYVVVVASFAEAWIEIFA